MESPIIRGAEVELKAQRARNAAYRKWAKRISTDIDRREQQRIEDENAAAHAEVEAGNDTYAEHCAWESRQENYI